MTGLQPSLTILGVAASALVVALTGYGWHTQWLKKKQQQQQQLLSSSLSTSGSIYSVAFLKLIQPLYDLHMGCENMGPMLYSLIRFLKPGRVLEIGAGYTSIYLLQALKDNMGELEARQKTTAAAAAAHTKSDDAKLMDDMFLDVPTALVESPALHIMDNMEHESTTAHLVQQTAQKLGSDQFLKVIVANCFEYSLTETYDFIWLDGITTDDQFSALFDNYCNKLLRDGGYIAVHSTLTNTVTRKWMADLIEEMKRRKTMVTVRFELKLLDSDDDLNALATSIRSQKSDIEWIGVHRLEPIGFGINKLVLLARMMNLDLAQDTAESIEGDFEDHVGSVDVFLDEDSPSVADFHHIGFLEPHKRFQNSFTIFQKRSSKYGEPIYSWSP